MRLAPNASVDLTVSQPIPYRLFPSLWFERPATASGGSIFDWRPELGNSQNDIQKGRERGGLYALNPGAPVILKVWIRETGKDVVLRAMPASWFGRTIGRDLVPSTGEGDPHFFPWPPRPDSRPLLAWGLSHLHISVLEVGEPLVGEQVTFLIEAPVGLKSVAPGYVPLLLFWFWPLYALGLAIYAFVLFRRTQRQA